MGEQVEAAVVVAVATATLRLKLFCFVSLAPAGLAVWSEGSER